MAHRLEECYRRFFLRTKCKIMSAYKMVGRVMSEVHSSDFLLPYTFDNPYLAVKYYYLPSRLIIRL